MTHLSAPMAPKILKRDQLLDENWAILAFCDAKGTAGKYFEKYMNSKKTLTDYKNKR